MSDEYVEYLQLREEYLSLSGFYDGSFMPSDNERISELVELMSELKSAGIPELDDDDLDIEDDPF